METTSSRNMRTIWDTDADDSPSPPAYEEDEEEEFEDDEESAGMDTDSNEGEVDQDEEGGNSGHAASEEEDGQGGQDGRAQLDEGVRAAAEGAASPAREPAAARNGGIADVQIQDVLPREIDDVAGGCIAPRGAAATPTPMAEDEDDAMAPDGTIWGSASEEVRAEQEAANREARQPHFSDDLLERLSNEYLAETRHPDLKRTRTDDIDATITIHKNGKLCKPTTVKTQQ